MLPIVPLIQELRRSEGQPLYRQLAEQLRALITKGDLPPGARLPASRELAKELGISRLSVVHAYEELRSLGLLHAQPGKGTFIAETDGTALPAPSAPPTRASRRNRTDLPHRALHEMMRASASQEGVISFSTGSAPPEFFPLKPLREALDAVLDRDGAKALGYEATAGYLPLRQAVREYVSTHGIQCRLGEVLITGGAQQAIDLVLQALTIAGDTVLAAHPTYLGLLDSVHARRLRFRGVPMDDEGLALMPLEEALLDNPNSHPSLIFAMPSFHNPTGTEMSLPRRRQLLRLATQYQVPILEDGVFNEFRYKGENLPPLKALDESGIVIHASTFSKNLLPGMRVGFIITTSANRERLESIKHAAEIATSSLSQRVIHWLLGRGIIAQQLGHNLREMRRRRDAALAAAAAYFPRSWRWQEPAGGFFLWVQLPQAGPTATELYMQALGHGVSFAIGDVFFADGGGSRNLRLNFVEQDGAQITSGFQRLARAWQELHTEGRPRSRRPLL